MPGLMDFLMNNNDGARRRGGGMALAGPQDFQRGLEQVSLQNPSALPKLQAPAVNAGASAVPYQPGFSPSLLRAGVKPSATPRSDVSSSVPPDRIPGMIQAGQRYGLSQQGYSPVPETDWMQQVAPAAGFGPGNPNRVAGPGQVAGTTDYRMPGQYAMGGTAPGYATFQGLPKAGGYLGYVGTPETQGMTQEQATAYNVGNINRAYDAMHSWRQSLNSGGSGGSSLPSPPQMDNPFSLPGSNRLDDAVRQQTAESALKSALDPRSKMTAKQRQAAIEGFQAIVAPSLQAYKQDTEAYNAGLNYLSNQGQQNTANQRALLEYQAGQNKLLADQAKLLADQANADRGYQLDYATKGPHSPAYMENVWKAYQTMGQGQRTAAENNLMGSYLAAQQSGNKAEIEKLQPLIEMIYRYRGNGDLLSSMPQPGVK